MFYAKSTGGFYDTAIHGDNIPADAVEITPTEHASLLDGQNNGQRIVADADGRPTLADPPAPTAAELAARVRVHRDDLFAASDWLVSRHREQIDAGAPTSLTAEQFAAVLAYRQELRDVSSQARFPGAVNWPKMDGSK